VQKRNPEVTKCKLDRRKGNGGLESIGPDTWVSEDSTRYFIVISVDGMQI